MAKIKKSKHDKTLMYLAFCEICGAPRIITKWDLRNYLIKEKLNHFICQCKHKNRIPDHLFKILDELYDSL